jgi:hypothetical protein
MNEEESDYGIKRERERERQAGNIKTDSDKKIMCV